MVSLRVDEQTAKQLQALAAERGMTIERFLKTLAEQCRDSRHDDPQDGFSTEEIESELRPLLFRGPSLPADFSREDIYMDRD